MRDNRNLRRKRESAGQDATAAVERRPRIVVAGLGNIDRGDDGVGPVLAGHIAARHLAGVTVVSRVNSHLDLLEAWKGQDVAILLDAMAVGAPAAGNIRRFEYPDDFFVEDLTSTSTHSMNLMSVVELAKELGQLPARLIVYGVAGRHFTIGAGLSSAVASAADEALRLVMEEIRSLCNDGYIDRSSNQP